MKSGHFFRKVGKIVFDTQMDYRQNGTKTGITI